jgi:hypothetical protein
MSSSSMNNKTIKNKMVNKGSATTRFSATVEHDRWWA